MTAKGEKKLKLIAGYCRLESNDMNIVEGIISIIFEYHKSAKWSKQFKGSNIALSEDDSKAMCFKGSGHSVRADFHIQRGQVISWEFVAKIIYSNCNFFGVVSSEVTNFETCPDRHIAKAYGIDDSANTGYTLDTHGLNDLDWTKPKLPIKKEFVLKMIADWKGEQCKLTIFYEGNKLNETNNDCTILLPQLDDKYVWYPCVTPYNQDAYCIIRYA